MATDSWHDFVPEFLPGWLGGVWGERLMGFLALGFDAMCQGLTDAARAAWLAESASPDDALPLVGSERRLEQYPAEPLASYRARLIDAWNAYTYAGNESSWIEQLENFGLSDIEIKTAFDPTWDWDSLAPGPATWAEGVGGAANWSRFWVIIKGHPWTASTDVLQAGLTATPEEIATVRRIVQKWRAVESLNPWIIIVLDPVTWALEQPDGTWYDHRNRSRSARYIDGAGQHPILLP